MRSLVLVFLLCFLTALALIRNSLDFPWFYDDAHLMRVYSSAELAGVWHGPYDPDALENAGYRPLTTWFQQVRMVLFGENTALHRIFSAALLALVLAVLASIAIGLGMPVPFAALAAFLTLCARYTTYYIVWLTEGPQLLGLLFVGLAALLILSNAAQPARWKWLGCFAAAACALLTRDHAVIAFPALVGIGVMGSAASPARYPSIRAWWADRQAQVPAWRAVLILTLGLFGVCLAYFGLRAQFVSSGLAATTSLSDLIGGLQLPFMPMGQVIALPEYTWLRRLWQLLLVGVAIGLLFVPYPVRVRALFWLLVAVSMLWFEFILVRVDLFLLQTLCFNFFICEIVAGLVQRSRVMRVALATIFFFVLFGLAGLNMLTQESMHPRSLDYVYYTGRFTYDPYVPLLTVPPPRRAEMDTLMQSFGMDSKASFYRIYAAQVAQADAAERRRPTTNDAYFDPYIHFFQH